MFDPKLVLLALLKEPRFWVRIGAAVLFIVVAVGAPLASRQSTAAGQDSVAGQTDLGLQRRQVRALERIATEMAEANRNARRCR